MVLFLRYCISNAILQASLSQYKDERTLLSCPVSPFLVCDRKCDLSPAFHSGALGREVGFKWESQRYKAQMYTGLSERLGQKYNSFGLSVE